MDPVSNPAAPIGTPGVVCTAFLVRKGVHCTRPAVARVTAGCVHEHIRTTLACAECITRLRTDKLLCRPCHDAGHDCVLIGREDPL
jgi:hypothetical protein